MKSKMKKLLALLLCLTMCFSVTSPALAAYYAAGTVVEEDYIAAGTVVDEDAEPQPTITDSTVYTTGTVVDEDTGVTTTEPTVTINPNIPITQPDEFPEPREVTISEDTGSEDGIATYAAPKSATLYIQDANVLAPEASYETGFTILGGSTFNNTYPKIVKYADGTVAAGYCADHHASLPSLGAGGMATGSPNFSKAQQELCGDIMAIGYQQTSGTTIPAADRYKWLITQIVIWAVRCDTITRDKNGDLKFSADGVSTINDFVSQIGKLADYVGGGNYDNFNTYATQLVYSLQYLRKIPSFAKTSPDLARRSPILLEFDSSSSLYKANEELVTEKSTQYNTYIKKLVSDEVIASDFDFINGHGIDGLTVAISGDNSIGYRAYFHKTDGTAAVSNKLTRTIKGGTGSVICWKDGSGYTQQILTSNYETENLSAYFGVRNRQTNTIESGIHKESDDGEVSGISFTFTGGGQTYTLTTDANGDIDTSSLPQYEKEEILDDEGNGTGEFIEDTTKPITYTVREITPIKYVEPPTETITPANGEKKDVQNVTKKFRIIFTKRDSETGTAQGDATLSGAQYGLYKDGVLIDTYYTNSLGKFTTDWFPCGSGYTIKEMAPSAGYLLNPTAYSVGLTPSETTVEYTTINQSGDEGLIKGNVRIIKHTDKGETGVETPEQGAKFEIFLSNSGSYENAKETERDVITTDADGIAESKDLPYGSYTVHQIEGMEGREFSNDFEVFVSENGKTYSFILNNRVYEALVTIMKRDSETGKMIPVSGIGFKIKNKETGEFVSQHINYPTPQTLTVFYTDTTGKLMLPEKLDYGTYELIEFASAYGYVLNQEPVEFVIDGTAKEVVVTKYNTPQKGQINIHKQGEAFASVEQNADGSYTPVYSLVGLEGAVFEITAAEDIYTPDNTLRYAMSEVVDTITTDSEGDCASKPLYLGRYIVREKTAPEGYALNTAPIIVTLSYAGQNVDISNESLNVTDVRQKASVAVAKQLEQDTLFGIGQNQEWLNVTFGLFAAEELTAADGTSIPAGGLIGTASPTEDNLRSKFTADIPFGNYYVQEIATDEHYILSDEQYPITFDYQGQSQMIVYLHANEANSVFNEIKRGKIVGTKTDEDGLMLEGAVFGLFKSDETEFAEDTALYTATSLANGVFTFTDIPYGDYLVRELTAPEGFVLNEEPYAVSITEDGEAVSLTAENKFAKGSVKLTKTDSEYTGRKLTGAVFDIYADSDGDGELDKTADVKVGTLVETDTGIYEMSGIRYGGYFAVEVTAPDNYVVSSKPIYFKIEKDGQIIKLTAENDPAEGTVKIIKTSEDGKVDGIRFTLSGTSKTGDKYEIEVETDENGEILTENLRVGTYTVSEVRDESTIRYLEQPDQTVTVTEGNTAEVKFYNKLARGTVYLNKIDPEDDTADMSGAEFKLYKDNDFNRKYDSKIDTEVCTLQSEGNFYWTEDLGAGMYLLKETKAPNGYVLDENYYPFEITDETAQLEITNCKNGFENSRKKATLKIIKTDADGKLLKGANFAVTDEDGESVIDGTTNDNGELVIENLPCGTYTVTEIAAPSGYERDGSAHKVELAEHGKVVTLTVVNTKTPFYVPQTGDGRINPKFWAILATVCACAAVGIGFVMFSKKKKSKKN